MCLCFVSFEWCEFSKPCVSSALQELQHQHYYCIWPNGKILIFNLFIIMSPTRHFIIFVSWHIFCWCHVLMFFSFWKFVILKIHIKKTQQATTMKLSKSELGFRGIAPKFKALISPLRFFSWGKSIFLGLSDSMLRGRWQFLTFDCPGSRPLRALLRGVAGFEELF